MRGVITAQILGQLEDSIKQVLWKERLITPEAANALLDNAVERTIITPKTKQKFLDKYRKGASAHAGMDISNIGYKELWDEYQKQQHDLLSPPEDWRTLKQCFDVDIADFFDQLAGTSTGGLLALYCE